MLTLFFGMHKKSEISSSERIIINTSPFEEVSPEAILKSDIDSVFMHLS